MANIKFSIRKWQNKQKLLKEAAWDHTSGKPLPTLEDVQKAYEAKKHLKEEYIELMQLDDGLESIKKAWEDWRNGPATNYDDVPPAYKELEKYIAKWIQKNLR